MTILGIIQLSTEVVACITSVLFLKPLHSRRWTLWVPFLMYTCVTELWAAYIAASAPDSNNVWLYNPYIIISLTFHGWFLIYIAILAPRYKKRLYYTLFILAACVMTWYLAWGDRNSLISLPLNIGSVIICLLCLLFFYTQIRNPFYHHSLPRVPGFWIVAGLLVFYTGISLYTSVYDFLEKNGIFIMHATIQNFIPQVLSLFLYTSITISIIQCRYPLKT